ncbi:MAG: methyltransferase domain-containing protein [Chitinophagaceae bacterium]|nr:methyltransferase domain-containing protein [Chitinophagaceae bacterium]
MKYQDFENLMICPECRLPLDRKGDIFNCSGNCGCEYPVYFGIPVIISCKNPVFKVTDFADQSPPDIFFKKYNNPILRLLKQLKPDITLNKQSKKNYAAIAELIADIPQPKILIIGGSIDGQGISALKQQLPTDTILIESDVAHGPNTNIILDAHHIPFKDESFDLVIAQAVLEHVLDPFQCVKEIHRVLKPQGMMYAETPFMQQVHGGKYDFHRFTHLGHRRLFRQFTELNSGVIAGPGSVMAWSALYFMTGFAPTKKIDKMISFCGSFLVFWWKYFDYLYNSQKGGVYDAACGLFFLGKKEPGYVLADEELLSGYRGHKS